MLTYWTYESSPYFRIKNVKVSGKIRDIQYPGPDQIQFYIIDGTYNYHNNVDEDERHSGYTSFNATKRAALEQLEKRYNAQRNILEQLTEDQCSK